ncbi:hypothetical protein LC085_06730 [Bacillus tianshenii]|nr:hypothetical protein [Bacillus tianshenii]MCA1319605.1 hypothetical protein [Bacillus tianshenii]
MIFALGFAFRGAFVEPPQASPSGVSAKRFLPQESSPIAPTNSWIA